MDISRLTAIPDVKVEPDFNQLLKVLRREVPDRPTLFEFFLNGPLYEKIASGGDPEKIKGWPDYLVTLEAFRRCGYDYLTFFAPGFGFDRPDRNRARTFSMSHEGVITDRESFKNYVWRNPDDARYELYDKIAAELPSGMKVISQGPGGVEENLISLVGYTELCMMLADDPELVDEICDNIGSRLLRYYENIAKIPVVGACIANDDWGFNTQTLLSPKQMERYIFPWYRKIVKAVHDAGKPVILHSCGHFMEIVDTMIDDLKFDARHSYEDNIMPVEDFYERFHERIAVCGGIDLNFVCQQSPEAVYRRAKAMLERTATRGGYALGTGNSVPDYVPDANYFAMIRAAIEDRE